MYTVFKCQEFGHVAAGCTADIKCPNCAGNHKKEDCKAAEKTCANCGANHPSNFAGCPVLLREREASEAKTLSYSDAVKKGGDQLECARLACTLSEILTRLLAGKTELDLDRSAICTEVAACVSRCYKVSIPTKYVLQGGANSIRQVRQAANPQVRQEATTSSHL